MQLESTKVALAVLWGVALFATGFAANVTSILAWSVLGGLAVLPPIVMVRLWNDRPRRVPQHFQAPSAISDGSVGSIEGR